jgi:hypothetical protein
MPQGSGQVVFRTVWSPNPFDGGSCFEATKSAFDAAVLASPTDVRVGSFRFAEDLVRVTIVGGELAERIFEPFSHLRSDGEDSSSPDLLIELWDGTTTGIPFPSDTEDGPLGPVSGDGEWTFTLGAPADRFVCHRRAGMITWLDRERGHLVGGISDWRQLSAYDLGKPLFLPLLLWHADRGTVVIHAALVADDGVGLLLVGKEGSGKTSAALACLGAGFDYLGDDYIGLRRADRGHTGYSLYGTAWASPSQFRALLGLSRDDLHEIPGGQKALARLSPVFNARLVPNAHIAAVAVTHWAPQGSPCVWRISPVKALLAVGPSSLLRLPISKTTHLEVISRLVQDTPCFQLDPGQDPQATLESIEQILSQVRWS